MLKLILKISAFNFISIKVNPVLSSWLYSIDTAAVMVLQIMKQLQLTTKLTQTMVLILDGVHVYSKIDQLILSSRSDFTDASSMGGGYFGKQFSRNRKLGKGDLSKWFDGNFAH